MGRRRRREEQKDLPEEVAERQKRKREDDALLKSQDALEIGQAVERMEQELQNTRKKRDSESEEVAERLQKRIQILRIRRTNLLEKEKRRQREKDDYENRASRSSNTDAFEGETVTIDGRQVLVGGTGSIPLPDAVKAPPPPAWPPATVHRRIPSPPPYPQKGREPPPLRPVPHPPPRFPKKMPIPQPDSQTPSTATSNGPAPPQIPLQGESEAEIPTQVKASVDMSKLLAQLGRG